MRLHPTFLFIPFAITVLVLSACGSGGSAGSPSAGTAAATQTVAVENVSGVGDVLVDAKGKALYSPDQEAGGKILCTGSCTAIWVPLTLPAGMSKPTSDVAGIGVVMRPDGGEQVAFDGKPLYSFTEDQAGQVTGDGFVDDFGGQSFTWHVASPTGTATGSTSTGGGIGY